MLTPPHITHSSARPAAVIAITTPRNRIQEVMGPAFQELHAALAAQGLQSAGPFFSHHLRMDPEVFQFELGVPIDGPLTPVGRVQVGELPAARVARAELHGPYEQLAEAWSELNAWVREHGHSPGVDLWESYLTGPEAGPDPASWRTELNRPLV